jgi:broad specificity phosphatase PhoE
MSALRLAVLLAALVAARADAQSSTLVLLVRHAEKAAQPANDPPLTPAGETRARALADMLANAGISQIISTPYERTMGTAAPLAKRLGLIIELIPIPAGTASAPLASVDALARHVQAVADAVRRYAGEAILVVGHSNTIPAIAAALGAPRLPDLCDGDYDQIFVLELRPSGPPRFMRTRFGAPAADAACASMR